jgi:CBS domain-containing protein
VGFAVEGSTMKVRDAMAKTISTASPTDTVRRLASVMKKEDCGFVPVVEEGRLVGVVTDRDIVLRCLANGHGDIGHESAAEIMSPAVVTVAPDDDLEEAAHRMARSEVRRLPVLEDGHIVGILSLGNVVQATEDTGPAVEAVLGVTHGA